MEHQPQNGKLAPAPNSRLKRLTPEQVCQIDDLLVAVGDYGEVHLIVQRGELRYVNKVESHKAWNDYKDK